MTTIEAAKLLGLTRGRIWQLYKAGALTGAKEGRDVRINSGSVKKLQGKREYKKGVQQ